MFADDLIEEEVAATMKSLVHKFTQRCAPSRNAMKIRSAYPAKFKAMVLCDFDNSTKGQHTVALGDQLSQSQISRWISKKNRIIKDAVSSD